MGQKSCHPLIVEAFGKTENDALRSFECLIAWHYHAKIKAGAENEGIYVTKNGKKCFLNMETKKEFGKKIHRVYVKLK